MKLQTVEEASSQATPVYYQAQADQDQSEEADQQAVLFYSDAVAPSTKMVAEDIQSHQEEVKDTMNAEDIKVDDYYYDNYYEDNYVENNRIDWSKRERTQL